GYDVTFARDGAEAVAACRGTPYDVIIAGHKDGQEHGSDALAMTLMDRPAALRLLVIDDEELFLGARGAAAAQVDYYLLHRDVREHIAAAIEDGLVRKDMSRQMLLRGGGALGNAYAAHTERLERLLDTKAIRFAYQPILEARS